MSESQFLAPKDATPFISEDVRMLTDLGFLALSRGLDRHALAIFSGVKKLRPTQEAGPLGLAMVHLFRGEVDRAVTTLRALKPSDAALTFLGIALMRKGDKSEAKSILDDVIASAPDSPYAAIAREALG